MTPDEIHTFLLQEFDVLTADEIQNGWSFSLKPKRSGKNPNRIARAKRTGEDATKLRLAITERLGMPRSDFIRTDFDHFSLKGLIDNEIRLYLENFMTEAERSALASLAGNQDGTPRTPMNVWSLFSTPPNGKPHK